MRSSKSPAERLHARLFRASSGCLEWQGYRHPSLGYGLIRLGGRDGRRTGVHRLAYELAHGPIPAGLFVCHSCDNPPCCEPSHLFLGTPADNTKDMRAKGRGTSGPRPDLQRLTDAQVRSIRSRVAAGERQVALAAEFGLSSSYVSTLVARIHRKDVA